MKFKIQLWAPQDDNPRWAYPLGVRLKKAQGCHNDLKTNSAEAPQLGWKSKTNMVWWLGANKWAPISYKRIYLLWNHFFSSSKIWIFYMSFLSSIYDFFLFGRLMIHNYSPLRQWDVVWFFLSWVSSVRERAGFCNESKWLKIILVWIWWCFLVKWQTTKCIIA